MKTIVLITMILTSLYQRRRWVLDHTATCCHYHQGNPSMHYLHIALIKNWTAVTHDEIRDHANKCTTITTYKHTAIIIQQGKCKGLAVGLRMGIVIVQQNWVP